MKSLVVRLRQTSSETKKHLGASLVILAITTILFAPVMRGRTFSMVAAHMFVQYPWTSIVKNTSDVRGRGFPQTDNAEFFYPTSVFATNAIRSGQLPMWLPYSFNGVPQMEIGVGNGLLYPPRLLAMTIFSPVHQHDLILFTHLLLAGLMMYALLRVWSANAIGALLGAIVWEFNGQQALFLTFESLAITAVWFPLMMLAATLAIRKQSARWAVMCGAALGISILAGIYPAYVSAWVLICWYFVLTVLAARRFFQKEDRRAAIFCLLLPIISAAVAAALGAASWLSLFALLSHVNRGPVTVAQQLNGAFHLRDLLRGLILPRSISGIAGKPLDFASFAFAGWPALVFALIGFFRRSLPVILAAAVGLISLGMLLGLRPIILFLRIAIPYFAAMHIYAGFFLLCFAIAVLAALGFTEINRRGRGFNSHRRLRMALVAVMIVIEVVPLIVFAWIVNPAQPVRSEWLYPRTPLINTLQAQQGEFHMLPLYFHSQSGGWRPPMLAGKVSANFELRSGSGYEELLPAWTAAIWREVEKDSKPGRFVWQAYNPYFYHDQLPMALLEKLSVGLLAGPPNITPQDTNGDDLVASGALKLIYHATDGSIYKVTKALPRAFLVPRVVIAPDADAAFKMFVDESFDAHKAAIVIADSPQPTIPPPTADSSLETLEGTAVIVSDRLNEVQIEVDTPRPGILILNDSWDPGWKAKVDGLDQTLLRVNYGFRGVPVTQGKHKVTFLYRPAALLAGMTFSGITLVFLLIWFIRVGLQRLRKFRQAGSMIQASS